MKVAEIQFAPWDKKYFFDITDFGLQKGDYAIVETSLGQESGKVISIIENSEAEIINLINKSKNESNDSDGMAIDDVLVKDGEKITIKPVLRKATSGDIKSLAGYEDRKKALKFCKETIVKYDLPMKLVDVHFSFDNNRVTFAFIADGRVDFRELVKELTRHFNKSVRLHQIGIRDEAKLCGDCGACGKELCCKTFLKDLVSITSDMAEVQAVAHRGSDRISGICGRLMCCLAYEEKGYRDIIDQLPKVGTRVNKDGKRGVVIGINPLKKSINVQFDEKNEDGRTMIEIDMSDKIK